MFACTCDMDLLHLLTLAWAREELKARSKARSTPPHSHTCKIKNCKVCNSLHLCFDTVRAHQQPASSTAAWERPDWKTSQQHPKRAFSFISLLAKEEQ
eukprot:1157731-Pelagomonas_calceolata.AAC.16